MTVNTLITYCDNISIYGKSVIIIRNSENTFFKKYNSYDDYVENGFDYAYNEIVFFSVIDKNCIDIVIK